MVSTSWETFATVRASMEPLKGYDKAAAQASWPGSEFQVGMRYLPGLDTTMRILFEGLVYSIVDVDDVDMRHRELVLICQTGVKAS